MHSGITPGTLQDNMARSCMKQKLNKEKHVHGFRPLLNSKAEIYFLLLSSIWTCGLGFIKPLNLLSND
jgi:hypothetical protein